MTVGLSVLADGMTVGLSVLADGMTEGLSVLADVAIRNALNSFAP